VALARSERRSLLFIGGWGWYYHMDVPSDVEDVFRQAGMGFYDRRMRPAVDQAGDESVDSIDPARDSFGSVRSRAMPTHLFHGAVRIDHSTAERADIDKQNYTVCPRHWYVDAAFRCRDCGELFTWSAGEQRVWFEEYGFYVDSQPVRCPKCRKDRRTLKALQQEYDRMIGPARAGATLEEKKQVLRVIDQITEVSNGVPENMRAARDLLQRQIRRVEGTSTGKADGADKPTGQ
jgi:hypothetical protein